MPVTRSRSRVRPQQLAWGVLLLSFAVFCVLCIISAIGGYYFLYESTVPMQSQLRVSRGTAVVSGADMIEQAVRSGLDLFNRAMISTDPQSQATLSFFDQQRDNALVAMLTMRSGSSFDMQNVSRPRFDWSSKAYWINLTDVFGQFELFIPDDFEREIVVSLQTTHGVTVRLTAGGQYAISSLAEQVSVSNYRGEALIVKPDRQQSRPVELDQRVVYLVDGDQLTTSPTFVNLVGARSFSRANVIGLNNEGTSLPDPLVWRCNSVENDAPRGSWGLVSEDGRPAVRFARGEGATSHAEASCSLSFGSQGIDVSQYSYLSLRATFKIGGHSLSTCGTEGSECPLMLRMFYYPVPDPFTPPGTGETLRSWFHGFFSTYQPERNFPLRCQDCIEQHEIVNAGTWYTYETGNLVTLLGSQRPREISIIKFDASGHEYDVYISEIALLADGATPAATSDPQGSN